MPSSAQNVISEKIWSGPSAALSLPTVIVGHQSAKTAKSAKSAKSAKFFIQQKTAKKNLPQLADLAATANLYFRLAISFL